MTAAGHLAFPGSRTLAGWWRQLTPWQPRALWIGHLLFHRVDALVRLTRSQQPDRFSLLVLQALAPGETLQHLNERLHLGPQLLGRVLRSLEGEGLAQPDAGGRWTPTVLGSQALECGEYPRPIYERRAFHFLNHQRPERPPAFLNLGPVTGSPWSVDWQFDVHDLEACLRQPLEWKQQYGFPVEVEAIVRQPPPSRDLPNDVETPTSADPNIPEWQRVIVEQPEHLLTALVLAPAADGGERLLGFAARQEHWVLQAEQPAFSLEAGWQGPFPDLREEPSLSLWHQAWRAWGQPRGLSPSEIDACDLVRQDYRLRVHAPRSLIDHLRLLRSDALKGEAWVLAGEGRIRTAALLEMVEANPPAPARPSSHSNGQEPTSREPHA